MTASMTWFSVTRPTVGAFLLRARREGLRDFGACMSPHSAWLILQGIETLGLRMARHMQNTEAVVALFGGAPPWSNALAIPCWKATAATPWPSNCCPRGAGSVFSFDIKGSRAQGQVFVEALRVFSHLANVGGLSQLGHSAGQHDPLSYGCRRALKQAGITHRAPFVCLSA